MEINERKAGVILSYVSIFLHLIISFIYIPSLLNILGKNEYGLYQMMGSLIGYLSIMDFGMSSTITRYYTKYKAINDKKNMENVLALSTIIYFFISIIALVFGIILYFKLDSIYGNSLSYLEIIKAKKIFIVLIINTIMMLSEQIFTAVINSNQKFIFLRILSLSKTLIQPIVIISLISVSPSAFTIVLVQLAFNFLVIVFKIYYSIKRLRAKIKLHHFDKELFLNMGRFSIFIFITTIADQIFWNTDQILLGAILGTSAVAVYAVASQIYKNYMSLSTAMSGVFLPKVVELTSKNASITVLSNIFIKIGRLQFLLLSCILSGFILFGKEFIHLWIGKEFNDVYYITLIIIIPFTIDLIQNIGLTILQAKNKYSFRAKLFISIALLNIITSIPLILLFGEIGSAFGTGLSFLIGNGIVMNIYYHKNIGIDIKGFWKEIGKISVPLAVSLFLGTSLNHIYIFAPVINLIFKIVLYLIIYCSLMWLIAMNDYEKNLIKKPINQLIRKLHN